MNTAASGLAVVGGCVCLGTAAFNWPSHTAQGLVTPLLFGLVVFGSLGVVAAFARVRERLRKTLAIVLCTGGLISCGLVGFMSIGPPTLAAALLFLCAAVLNGPWSLRNVASSVLVFLASSVFWFSILFFAATRIGVQKVQVPDDSDVLTAFPLIDYADAFQVCLPPGFKGDIEYVVNSVATSMMPSWLQKRPGGTADIPRLQPGSTVGHWPVHSRTRNEIVLGLDRSFIDLRLSVLVRDEADCRSVTASTVARYNNWIGRIYFIPVRYGHQIVLADTMRKTKAALAAQSDPG